MTDNTQAEYMEASRQAREIVRINSPAILKKMTDLFDSVSRDVYALAEDGHGSGKLTAAEQRGVQDGVALGLDEIAKEIAHTARWDRAWDFEIMEDDEKQGDDGGVLFYRKSDDQSTTSNEPAAE